MRNESVGYIAVSRMCVLGPVPRFRWSLGGVWNVWDDFEFDQFLRIFGDF